MKFLMLNFGHEFKIFLAIVEAISIYMVNNHIVWAVHDLSVHPNHKRFGFTRDFSVSITVIPSSARIPNIRSDPVRIFVVDYRSPLTAFNKRAIKKLFGFSIYFYEH